MDGHVPTVLGGGGVADPRPTRPDPRDGSLEAELTLNILRPSPNWGIDRLGSKPVLPRCTWLLIPGPQDVFILWL